MNILQINAVNAIASTGRNVKELSDFLNTCGHNSVVAYSKGPSVDPEHEYHIGSNLDTKIHAFLSRLTGKQGYFSRGATKRLLKFMDEYKPDVVVLNNLHGNYINLTLLLKYLAKKDIATVAVLHDCWFYTGKCCHYTVEQCFKWQGECGKCPSLKKHNKSWFFDHTKKMLADKKRLFGAIPRLAVVGVSDWIKNEAKKAPVFENAKIITRIYNWIDTEKFSPKDTEELRKKLGLEGKKVILSVASGWNKDKGLDTVLELSEKLNADEHIVLVGNLPSDVSLNDKILHIPATNSVDELAELYSMADVFLQPSLEETFGKVTAEALACGTPAVCFDSTANPELIGKGCGAVVLPQTTAKLHSKINEVVSNELVSNTCVSFAQKHFSKHNNLTQYLSLFKSITDESGDYIIFPKRILHIVPSLALGGTEAYIMNNYRAINRNEFQFDFFVFNQSYQDHVSEIETLGGKVFWGVNPSIKNTFKFIKILKSVIETHGPYQAVHCHADLGSWLPIVCSAMCGIKVRIAHSHAILLKPHSVPSKILFAIRRFLLSVFSTKMLSCSDGAGESLFGAKAFHKKGCVHHNGIAVERFLNYDEDAVARLKTEFNIPENTDFVFGNISRFDDNKNQEFIVDTFCNILREKPKALLLLGGVDGGRLSNIIEKVKTSGIEDRVRFIGPRKDVNLCLQLIDVYVLPSRHEGFGIALLEAQAAKCLCFASTGVPSTTDLGLVSYLSLDLEAQVWAERMLEKIDAFTPPDEAEILSAFQNKGYDIRESASGLVKNYEGK